MNEGNVPLLPNFKPRHESLKDRTLRYLLGEDVFISYSRVDGRPYALDLANKLASKNYSCKFDQWGTLPGEKLPMQLKLSLRRSAVLVLICTEAASKSNSVKEEIEEFLKTGRFIVPVDVEGWLGSAGWEKHIRGIPSSLLKQVVVKEVSAGETPADEQKSEADLPEDLVDRIEKTFTFSRKDQRIKKTLVTGLVSLVVILAVGLLAAGYAEIQTRRALAASREAEVAVNARNAAVQEREKANSEKDAAIRERNTASQQAATALEQQKTAEENARKAEEKERLAKAEADRQGKIAESSHLATEADRIRNEQGRYIEASMAKALKSRAISLQVGTDSLSTYDALRETTAIFPELLNTLPQESASKLTLTPDDRSLIALRKKDLKSDSIVADVWDLAENRRERTIGNAEQGYVHQVSGDGNHILTHRGNQFVVWGARTGIEEWVLPLNEETGSSRVAINFDGSLVITSHFGGPARVWSVKEKRLLYAIEGIRGGQKFAFSRDGIYLAAAQQESGAGVTKVFYTSNGSPIEHEKPFFHEGHIQSIAISTDGEYVGTVSRFTSPFQSAFLLVKVWAVNDFTDSEVISLVIEGLQDMSFTSDQLILVTKDGSVQIVDLNGNTTSSVGDRYNPARRASISPNGQSLLTINTDSTARLWDLSTGREMSRMYHKAGVNSAVFSKDGSEVFTAGADNLIKRWKPATGLVAGVIRGGDVTSFLRSWTFSTDGALMAANTLETVTVWDSKTGRTINTLRPENHTLALAFSPNSNYLVTAGKVYGGGGDEYSIQSWNTRSDKKDALAQAQMLGWVKDVAVSNDGSSVLIYVEQVKVPGVVRWDTKSGTKEWLASEEYIDFFKFADRIDPNRTENNEELTRQYESVEKNWKEKSPTVAAIAPDGSLAITISRIGEIRAVNSKTSPPRWRANLNAKEIDRLRQYQATENDFDRAQQLESIIIFSSNMKYVAVTFPGLSTRIFDPQTGREVSAVTFGADEKFLRFSPHGDYIIAQVTNNSLRVLTTAIGKEALALSMQFDIKAANISFDQNLLVVEAEDRSCEVWNLRKRQRVARIRTSTAIEDVAFSDDSNRLLTRERGAKGSTWIRFWIWRPTEIESIATRLLTANSRP